MSVRVCSTILLVLCALSLPSLEATAQTLNGFDVSDSAIPPRLIEGAARPETVFLP